MYTVLVKYELPEARSRAEMMEAFKAAEVRFRSVPQLIRKYFCYDEAAHTGHSVYLWENREAAEAFFNEQLIEEFKIIFGTTPKLFMVDTLMVIDNAAHSTILNENAASN